jgi:uncharacterized protein (TIGR01777 family)
MSRILLTGGSGFLGSHLLKALEADGHEVTRVALVPDEHSIGWSSLNESREQRLLQDIEVVIHLAGKSLMHIPWTEKQKTLFYKSRIDTTRVLSEALIKAGAAPVLWVGGSAIGYYGSCPGKTCVEDSSVGDDFLAKLCRDWELQHKKASQSLQSRLVLLRTGVVLGAGGGMLKTLIPVFKFCMGAVLGNGKQSLSWIHITDWIEALRFLINLEHEGVFNLTSPEPETNFTFSQTLAKKLKRFCILKVPSSLLKVFPGEAARAMILSSQRVLPQALINKGYRFRFSSLDEALSEIFRS